MSGLRPNSLTLYLRPQAEIQPYREHDCARWLVERKKFRDVLTAKLWLTNMAESNPWIYRAVLSEYFEATDYKQDYHSKRDVNKYRSTTSNYYGEELHMW